MLAYDPSLPPEPKTWLDLDELERIRLIEVFHRTQRIKPPNLKAHAAFHAIVESQLAEGVESVVGALGRLIGEGLTRHDALHAIGSVLADQLHELVTVVRAGDSAEVAQSRYDAALERLSAEEWRRLYGKE
jgi:hypothetical protein